LETLRLMLVHETIDPAGLPRGLELAYSTPRAWLAAGKQIAVRRLQTSFGQLSYTLDATATDVRASIDLPAGYVGPLRLRLRLPAGQHLGAVTVGGNDYNHLADPATIDLSGLTGHLDVVARRGQASAQNSPRRPRASRIAWFCSVVCGRQSGARRSLHHATARAPIPSMLKVAPGW